MTSKALIIPAAGAGTRMERERPKPFIKLGKKTILEHTLSRFPKLRGLRQIIVATSSSSMDEVDQILAKCVGDDISWQCVEGGIERQHSIRNALEGIENLDLVLVHDAVRPFVEIRQVEECCVAAESIGAAVLGIPAKDTIKKTDENGMVLETPDRRVLWQVQTPQVFQTELLKQAYHKAETEDFIGTDDASLVEWLGKPVKVVRGDESNIKITYPRDLQLAQLILKEQNR